MARFSVIYDACVLYPAPLRDMLMWLALTDLFQARWTDEIHKEWMRALRRKKDFEEGQLERVRDLMDENVRDAKVYGYEPLIDSLSLPDPNDRHVLAAAIRSGSDAIVTFNSKDFPVEKLAPFNIEIIHPDDFVCYQLELSPGRVCNAIKSQKEKLEKLEAHKQQQLEEVRDGNIPSSIMEVANAAKEKIEAAEAKQKLEDEINSQAKAEQKKIEDAALTEKLIRELKTIPASDYAENLSRYNQLKYLHPENKKYQEKAAKYLAVAQAAEKKKADADARKKRFESQFSPWDGSHRNLEKVIKKSMNDPGSYEHTETVYWDRGDHLVVRTTFRGKNAFGGTVKSAMKAKVSLDGQVLEILD